MSEEREALAQAICGVLLLGAIYCLILWLVIGGGK